MQSIPVYALAALPPSQRTRTPMSFSNAVTIAGIGETDYSRDSGRTELALSLQAIGAALDDAGIAAAEVDGLMKWFVDTSSEAEVAVNLGIPDLAWFGEINQAGNVGAPLVAHAAAAIHAGLANTIVIYRGVNGRSGRRYGRGDVTGQGGRGAGAFTEPFGLLTPQHGLAMSTRRRMFETGVTSRQFGQQAVIQRKHANRNPRATFHDRPLTLEDHQESRLIVDPFHLFDCCLESDGGGALVLTRPELARERRPGRPLALIRAAAQSGPGQSSPVHRTAARLFAMAGLERSDIDVVQIYDHFGPFVLFALEDYGFVEDAGDFVEDSGTMWDSGKLPVNTSGGHLSEVYLQGMNHLIEGVRQARGESTSQVPNARLSFVDTGIGTGAVILERSDA
ncbi:MAG: lipid-transfer protein [Gammaproteobacteria bacterium]|nr:lipid-transfer protein [Gammaproteobacteria bacterium]